MKQIILFIFMLIFVIGCSNEAQKEIDKRVIEELTESCNSLVHSTNYTYLKFPNKGSYKEVIKITDELVRYDNFAIQKFSTSKTEWLEYQNKIQELINKQFPKENIELSFYDEFSELNFLFFKINCLKKIRGKVSTEFLSPPNIYRLIVLKASFKDNYKILLTDDVLNELIAPEKVTIRNNDENLSIEGKNTLVINDMSKFDGFLNVSVIILDGFGKNVTREFKETVCLID